MAEPGVVWNMTAVETGAVLDVGADLIVVRRASKGTTRVVRGARALAARRFRAPRGRLHPDVPWDRSRP